MAMNFLQAFLILKIIEVNPITLYDRGELEDFSGCYFPCKECIIKMFKNVFNNFTRIHRNNLKDYAFILRISLEGLEVQALASSEDMYPSKRSRLSCHMLHAFIMGRSQAPLC